MACFEEDYNWTQEEEVDQETEYVELQPFNQEDFEDADDSSLALRTSGDRSLKEFLEGRREMAHDPVEQFEIRTPVHAVPADEPNRTPAGPPQSMSPRSASSDEGPPGLCSTSSDGSEAGIRTGAAEGSSTASTSSCTMKSPCVLPLPGGRVAVARDLGS